jgi:CRP/FNR family transcriptional regulator, cyclic AMP receptor protein
MLFKRKGTHPFWGNLFQGLKQSENGIDSKLLSTIPIFKGLTRKELRVVSDILYQRRYEAGEDIFLIHQPGAAMFIIKSGNVNIQIETDQGENVILAELKEGEFFGEIALLENSPRSATATAVTNTDLLTVFRADLDKLISREPMIAAKIMKQLAVVVGIRLKETNKLLNSEPLPYEAE